MYTKFSKITSDAIFKCDITKEIRNENKFNITVHAKFGTAYTASNGHKNPTDVND